MAQNEQLIQGQAAIQPQDPQYQLEQHILFKRKQQILNHNLKSIIENNLSEFDLIMDGTNYAFTKLSLENQGIQQVTEIICAYSNLRKLDFGFNQLKDITFVQKLRFVTQLNLQRNSIRQAKFLQDSSVFPYLNKLNLQGNKLQALTIVQLVNLTHLNLNYNKIKSLDQFQGHKKLQLLQLRGNKITDLKGLANMPNLNELYLADNGIAVFTGLKNLPNLIKLHARKNKFEVLTEFPHLEKLKYLNLRQNLIKGVDNLSGVVKTVEIFNLLANPISQQLGDNAKKQIWMRYRHYERINKIEVGAEEKQQFDKEYKDRLAQQERQRKEKEQAQRQAQQQAERQAAQKQAQQ